MTAALVFYYFFRIDVLVYIAVALGFIGAFSAKLTAFIDKWWFKLAHMLGFVNSRILLSIIFFLILFPISLLQKLFGGNPAFKKGKQNSNYVERNHQYEAKDLDNIW